MEIDVLTGDQHVRRADLLVDLGSSINPALDIGQVEGAFTQGMGWTTTEDLIWGGNEHSWVTPGGRLLNAGPGGYKLPSFNDTPAALNVRLMSGADNPVAVHSSKAVGEPPFFLGATGAPRRSLPPIALALRGRASECACPRRRAVFFAIRDAVAAARAEHLGAERGGAAHFEFFSPATSERIRMACADRFAAAAVPPAADGSDAVASFEPKSFY